MNNNKNSEDYFEVLRKASEKSSNIAFLLGIGYKDDNKHQYKSYVPKPKINEIVKWR